MVNKLPAMTLNECCEKWAQEAKVLNPMDGTFFESRRCPKCGARLSLTFRRELSDAGTFQGYRLVAVTATTNIKTLRND